MKTVFFTAFLIVSASQLFLAFQASAADAAGVVTTGGSQVITDPKEISIARESLKNMSLEVTPIDGKASEKIQLKDGSFDRVKGDDDFRVEMNHDNDAPITLIRDGEKETAFFAVWISSGGTGHWEQVIEAQLKPAPAHQVKAFPMLKEDRAFVKDIKVKGSELILETRVHDAKDALCCASVAKQVKYPLK